MLKELQDKIKQEVERMQNKLVTAVKNFLNEENVVANVSEDLNSIDVFVRKGEENENRYIQNEYGFIFGVNDKGEVNKGISFTGSALLLQGGRIVGTYALPTNIDLNTLNAVFSLIEAFRQEELNPEKGEEAAPTE